VWNQQPHSSLILPSNSPEGWVGGGGVAPSSSPLQLYIDMSNRNYPRNFGVSGPFISNPSPPMGSVGPDHSFFG
jgi:hypothetical protein